MKEKTQQINQRKTEPRSPGTATSPKNADSEKQPEEVRLGPEDLIDWADTLVYRQFYLDMSDEDFIMETEAFKALVQEMREEKVQAPKIKKIKLTLKKAVGKIIQSKRRGGLAKE